MKDPFRKHVRTFLQLMRYWKLLNFRKIFYLPHIITSQEWRWGLILIAVIVISGIGLLSNVYMWVTVQTPKVGGAYVEGVLKEPRNINPVYAVSDSDRDIARLIFSRLLNYDGNGNVIVDLAASYTISPDGRVYTVVLREDARWHDGNRVTADDVLFTIKTIQNLLYKSPHRANWQGVQAEKLDEKTIQFSLRTPYPPFIENLAIGIIPRHRWEGIPPEQAFLHELNIKPIGSGPFIFSRLKQGKDGSISSVEVKRNPQYYREGPYLEHIIFRFFKTEDEMINAFRKRHIEGFGPLPARFIKEFEQSDVVINNIAMPRIIGIFFNEKKAPALADKKVREALSYALNKQDVARSTIATAVAPATSAFPLGTHGLSNNVPVYDFDPEKSKALLTQAGWSDNDGDGIREKKKRTKGKDEIVKLSLTLTTSDFPDLMRVAEIIRVMLRDVGISVTIEKRPLSDLETSVIRPRNFELLLFGHVYGYEPDPFTFWHSSQIKDPGLNIALYANKKADTLLEEARRTTDTAARVKKYAEVQKLIAQDSPAIFLYSQLYAYVLPQYIKGLNISKISLPSDRFNGINTWYRETKRVFR